MIKNAALFVSICDEIINAGLRCQNLNIRKVFVPSVAFYSKVATDISRKFNNFLYQDCEQYGSTFIDNGAVGYNDGMVVSIYWKVVKLLLRITW